MQWHLNNSYDKNQVASISKELMIDKALATILVQRGITSFDKAKHFFRPQLTDLHDPYLMKDMDLAVKRINLAIDRQENILIYGDYDVDGTTSVALLSSFLRLFCHNIATYIPDRYQEGYGISYQGIDFADDNDISLIITLDCGIKASDKIKYASNKNIDFIICDHHRPGTQIPEAVAVLDPKREDCHYPYKELCGCGIGFKLIQALAINRTIPLAEITPFLDLVAVAIAADIVPITGENRILAYHGLEVINSSPRVGIQALINSINKDKLSITDVVFMIAPKINAAGRMKHGLHAVELLTQQNFNEALSMAQTIEQFNHERKELDQTITEEALTLIKSNQEENNASTVVFKPHWHKGVIGIVASRLIETYYRPTIVFTKSGANLAASARSVHGFDIYNAIATCSPLIEQFGGHKYAAGLTIKPENYLAFKTLFEKTVKDTIPQECLTPSLTIDAELCLESITPKFFRVLQQFAPFGPKNMKPIFMARGLRDNGYGKKVGANEDHLKLNIIEGTNPKTYQAIGFGLGHKLDYITTGQTFAAVFTLEENHWNGYTSIQLNLKDVEPES